MDACGCIGVEFGTIGMLERNTNKGDSIFLSVRFFNPDMCKLLMAMGGNCYLHGESNTFLNLYDVPTGQIYYYIDIYQYQAPVGRL